MRLSRLTPPLLLLALAGPLHAAPLNLDGKSYTVEHTTGIGPNTALFELDFGTNLTPDTHLFAYQWTGSQTLATLMAALQTDNFGFSYATFPGTTGFLDTLGFGAQQPPDTYPSSFWYWFNASDTAPIWSLGQTAFDTVPLSNGDLYAWALQHDDPNIDVPFNAPPEAFAPPSHFPAAIIAVPEPASLALLALGAITLLRRRK